MHTDCTQARKARKGMLSVLTSNCMSASDAVHLELVQKVYRVQLL